MMSKLIPFRIFHYHAGSVLSSVRVTHSKLQPACSRGVNVWQIDRKSGYKDNKKERTNWENVKKGFQIMKNDIGGFKEELKENLVIMDKNYATGHGDYQYFSNFNNQKTIDSWTATADSDHSEGKSYAKLELNNTNKGVFHGFLNTELPKDGKMKRTGYVNIRSPLNLKAFHRFDPYDWSEFTHMYIRCRGDGRGYMLVANIHRFFDIMWDDQYQYPLYTQGGQHWQTTKIPLSKFFFTHKGRVQDKQLPIEESLIRSLGITLADGVTGPFKLEIDFIALTRDESHTEEFAYELYQQKKFQVGV